MELAHVAAHCNFFISATWIRSCAVLPRQRRESEASFANRYKSNAARRRVNQRNRLPALRISRCTPAWQRWIYCPALENQDRSPSTPRIPRLWSFGNGIFEVVHVGDGRHASANLLRRGQRVPSGKSSVTFLASAGKMYFATIVERHVVRNPRSNVIGTCVCPLMKQAAPVFLCIYGLRAAYFASMFARDPTPRSRRRPPHGTVLDDGRSAFIVTTVPPPRACRLFLFLRFAR